MIGLEQLERLWRSLAALGARRLMAMGVVGLTVFGAVGVGSYYLSRPQLETLYSGLTAQDVNRIGAALNEAGIHFDVNSQGTAVLVRYGQTAQARMLLAEKGLPSSANAGYELFDKLGSMGLTSFMQEITRVRALEGEIARTIQAMKGVKAARVHLVLPDAGSFRRTRQSPSASVIVRAELAGDFASAPAIRHLVAAAVPGLTVDQVTVLNTDGTILASGGDTISAAPGKMLGLEKSIAKELQDNVGKTLAPYLGASNFEISAAVRLNTDKRQISETAYSPESRVERSVRVIKETGSQQNSTNRAAVGVEQNVPAETQNAGAAGDQSKRANERREELTNYEVSTKTTSTVSEGYKIESLTVAVVVNRKKLAASLGDNPTPEAIDKQLKEIERLATTAAGIDTKRGDRITVAALEFATNSQALEPVPSVGMVEHVLRNTGSIVNAVAWIGVTVLLIWFGLRPALKTILETPVAKPAAAPTALGEQAGAARVGNEPQPNLIADLTTKRGRAPQRRLEQMIEYDEEQAAAVLKQWMHGARRMSATPAAKYLTEFGPVANRSALAFVGRSVGHADDEAARIAEAHASGVESGKAAALASLEAKLEEQRAQLARQLEAERTAWMAQEGDKLAAQMTAGLGALEAQIADAAARVLAPFLDAQLCRQAVAGLRAELEVLLAKDASLSVSISGPEDLLEALRKDLAGKAGSVTYVAGAGCDVRIGADQTLLETRLTAWKASIAEAVR